MSMTLEEIAKHAGVSRSTVSRVMNDHPSVGIETRARVLSVVESLNYQPNLAARSLAAGRTQILGLVIPTGVSTKYIIGMHRMHSGKFRRWDFCPHCFIMEY